MKGYDLVRYFSDVEDYITSEERAFCEGYEYAQREFADLEKIKNYIVSHAKSLPRRLVRNGEYANSFMKAGLKELGLGNTNSADENRMKALGKLLERGASQVKKGVDYAKDKYPSLKKLIERD